MTDALLEYAVMHGEEAESERRNWWQTEFWSKYMHAAVPYCVWFPVELWP